MGSYVLARCYETMMALKRAVPMTMAEYMKLETLMSTYDINKIIQRQGQLYVSIKNYYCMHARDIHDSVSFQDLTIPQVVYLSVILICDSQNFECRPFWPWEPEDVMGTSLESVLKYFTKDNWVQKLVTHLNSIEKRIQKLLNKKECFRKSRDEVSYIKSELKTSFQHIDNASQNLVKADCQHACQKLIKKRDATLGKLKDLSLKNVICREKINTYLEANSTV